MEEFFMLARTGNFHKAAEKLYITQPTLSNHIRALERDLGFELVDRKNGNQLTKAGSMLFWDAIEAVDTLNAAVSQCREVLRQDGTSAEESLKIVISEFYDYRYYLQRMANSVVDSNAVEFLDFDLSRPVLSPLILGEVDIVAIYDVPEIKKEAVKHGLACLERGQEQFALLFPERSLLANGDLADTDLASTSVVVSQQYAVGPWRTAIRDMLGDDIEMRICANDESEEVLARDENLMAVGTVRSSQNTCAANRGLTYRSELNGEPIAHKMMVVYDPSSDSESVLKFISAIEGD